MNHPETIESDTDAYGTSDAMLAQRASNGDLRAFEDIVRRYNQPLYRFARSLLKESSAAQDVLQEAYFKVYQRIGSFRGPAGFASWIFTIVRNEALMYLRSTARYGQLTERVWATAETEVHRELGPDDMLSWEQLAELADRCIDSLPDKMRTVFILREVDALSVNETATILGVNETTVKMRAVRAKKLLRSRLDQRLRNAGVDVYEFGGARCDNITALVVARIRRFVARNWRLNSAGRARPSWHR